MITKNKHNELFRQVVDVSCNFSIKENHLFEKQTSWKPQKVRWGCYDCAMTMTMTIPVAQFEEKVLAHSANSIAASKALMMMESNSIQTRKIGLIMSNGVDTATGFPEQCFANCVPTKICRCAAVCRDVPGALLKCFPLKCREISSIWGCIKVVISKKI